MRSAGFWLSSLAAAVVQATFLGGWRPFGIVPGLALVVVTAAAVLGTASQALISAVLAGLVLDLAAGDRFGVNTTFLVLVVLAAAWLRRGGSVFGLGLELAAVAAASLLRAILAAVLMLGHAGLPVRTLTVRLLVTMAVNVFLAFALYIPLRTVMHPAAEESYGKA